MSQRRDARADGAFGFDHSIGKHKVKISPTELYVRVDQAGQSHSQFKGTLSR